MIQKLDVFCFPHAGGGAHQYLTWQKEFPEHINWSAIDRAGRYSRINEAANPSFSLIVDDLIEQVLAKSVNTDFALFGHSMGGALAYEVTHELERRGVFPKCLFVSSTLCPPEREKDAYRYFDLEDDLFLEHLMSLSDEATTQNVEVLKAFLPDIRDEYRQYHEYAPKMGAMLKTPILALCGENEYINKTMDNWQELTQCFLGVSRFSGGHFYWKNHFSKVAEIITQQILL
ncbi:thioesterase II family protein [Vibrio caribbeanicus]|uniref:Thioesterase n=1 Tax=Vibrio caribbeanicus ATCC BAA-2122 TaxID=796620 RepID=E3BG37_9VIBR|nr:alpha/beta fold hydrolase [Vibrio caribbeanicus]EFP97962.1 thioesterase [Vibrio caribbeanicus ATCC BAA-2122]